MVIMYLLGIIFLAKSSWFIFIKSNITLILDLFYIFFIFKLPIGGFIFLVNPLRRPSFNWGEKKLNFFNFKYNYKKNSISDFFIKKNNKFLRLGGVGSSESGRFSVSNLSYKYFYFFLFFFNSEIYTTNSTYFSYKFKYGKTTSGYNIKSTFKRWVLFYNFIFNYFYYDNLLFFFGPFFFKNEILSFNWKVYPLSFSLWRLAFNMFVQRHRHSDTMTYLLGLSMELSLVLIADVGYHLFLINSLRLDRIGTIGIVSTHTINPWILTYPIFFLSLTKFVILFFIRFITLVLKLSSFSYYILLKNYFYFFKFNVNIRKFLLV